MIYHLNTTAVPTLSKQMSQSLCQKSFQNYAKIDGEQLISLTNSRQVNSFIIRSLFNQWKKEVERLESPYFDFKHEKVKAAVKQFMNVLSNHISIDQEHLEPLLERAISDTILITFAPKDFLTNLMDRMEKPQDFKKQFKYIKTNRAFFQQVVDHLGDFDTKASVLNQFDSLNEDLLEQTDAKTFMQKLEAESLLEDLFTIEEEKKQEEKTPTTEPQDTPSPKAEPQPTQGTEAKRKATLNDTFETTKKGQTLAEKLKHKVTPSIEASLTLNEKFMFQNVLFHGDAAKMREAFQEIDAAESLEKALEKANAYNQGWDMDSEEVEAFMEVLARKF